MTFIRRHKYTITYIIAVALLIFAVNVVRADASYRSCGSAENFVYNGYTVWHQEGDYRVGDYHPGISVSDIKVSIEKVKGWTPNCIEASKVSHNVATAIQKYKKLVKSIGVRYGTIRCSYSNRWKYQGNVTADATCNYLGFKTKFDLDFN